MKYPRQYRSSPTPSEMLAICEKCQEADWTVHTVPNIHHHYCGSRMREATSKEYAAAKASTRNQT